MTERLRRRRFVLAGAACACCAPLAAASGVDTLLRDAQPIIQSYFIGEEDEVRLGEAFYEPYVLRSGGLYRDYRIQAALKIFAKPILATTRRRAFRWDIALMRNDQANAWALPGGKLAVHSGLLHYVDHPAELASVIAHEMGHAELSHGLAQMRTQAFAQSLGRAGRRALSDYAGGAMAEATLAGLEAPVYGMVTAGYNRKRELEADAHILQVFARLGLDPSRADDFFRTLTRLYPSTSTATTSLFSTHPGTRERIERIEHLARTRSTPPATAPVPPGWAELKAKFPTYPV